MQTAYSTKTITPAKLNTFNLHAEIEKTQKKTLIKSYPKYYEFRNESEVKSQINNAYRIFVESGQVEKVRLVSMIRMMMFINDELSPKNFNILLIEIQRYENLDKKDK